MKEIILIKDGELALKGLNRSTFEDVLVKNIRWRIKKYGNFQFKKSQSTITITPVVSECKGSEITNSAPKAFTLFNVELVQMDFTQQAGQQGSFYIDMPLLFTFDYLTHS
jgi:adenylyl- and sulfurtransferase ThiI